MARRRRRLPEKPIPVAIHDLAHDGRGVGRAEDKVVFVRGALPGELVDARLTGRNRRFDEGAAEAVIESSPERIAPECPWFGVCGGCALQHLAPSAQLTWKQHRLAENFARIGNVQPGEWIAPISSQPWHYRRRARLSVRLVRAKGRVLVGFREAGGRFVADVEYCKVLHPAFAHRLLSLSKMIGGLSIPNRIAQVECAAGDESAAIVLRHLDKLADADLDRLREWSDETGIAVWLQSGGPDSVTRLHPEDHGLSYSLPAFDLRFAFHPQQFVQVNAEINQALVARAVEWMAIQSGERVLDLFCGLGNFSLPLASTGAEVVGVELAPDLVASAQANARANGIGNARFVAADLQQSVESLEWMKQRFDAVLIDPPRSGAQAMLPLIAATGARRVVYVSCDPATLARDVGLLVHEHGFSLARAGVADMFPHTAHVESIALLTREAA